MIAVYNAFPYSHLIAPYTQPDSCFLPHDFVCIFLIGLCLSTALTVLSSADTVRPRPHRYNNMGGGGGQPFDFGGGAHAGGFQFHFG